MGIFLRMFLLTANTIFCIQLRYSFSSSYFWHHLNVIAKTCKVTEREDVLHSEAEHREASSRGRKIYYINVGIYPMSITLVFSHKIRSITTTTDPIRRPEFILKYLFYCLYVLCVQRSLLYTLYFIYQWQNILGMYHKKAKNK